MTVLVLAPHADDEVIGMGGTIAKLVKEGRRVVVVVLTGHGEGKHPIWDEAEWNIVRAECRTAANIMGVNELVFRELPAVCLDTTPAWQINTILDDLVKLYLPTEIYLPFPYDLHKDHGAIAYGVSVVSRPYLPSASSVKRVLAYETLSETHLAPPYLTPGFQPNVYVNISDTLDTKLEAMNAYQSQLQPDHLPRSIAALSALARLRGTHIGCNAAEGFVLLGEYSR
jgi:LmbE family N-acetylglucosaminyl deacetylase